MFKNKKMLASLGYVLLVVVVLTLIGAFAKSADVGGFLQLMENKTFDLRQSILVNSGQKKVHDEIVILAIDDASYEYLLTKYGEWPIPRSVYADVVNYIEKQKPSLIAFDLMFVKSIKSTPMADQKLIDTISKYDNVYTSMNFDDQPFDVRIPENLDKKFSVNVKNNSDVKFSKNLTFSNCRTILPGIMQGTKNIGFINVSRSDDGILREVNPFMIYKGDFYPYLSLKTGLKYFGNL